MLWLEQELLSEQELLWKQKLLNLAESQPLILQELLILQKRQKDASLYHCGAAYRSQDFVTVFLGELRGFAWAVGSYSSSQSDKGTSQKIIYKTLWQIGSPTLYHYSAIKFVDNLELMLSDVSAMLKLIHRRPLTVQGILCSWGWMFVKG